MTVSTAKIPGDSCAPACDAAAVAGTVMASNVLVECMISSGALDGVSTVILTPLLAEIRRDAPGIDLRVRNLVGHQFAQSLVTLDNRELDAAILPVGDLPARFVSRHLYDEDFVIVRRAGHSLGRDLTLASYCAAPHLVVSVSGDPQGPVDRELAKRFRS